ncbi:hypothetical protein SAMN05421664_1051 [Chryseobacterium soldanellicola]|uniref:Uncharacterized protein n=2 Tax=Chryseobacterium soldanellicola TaxID=311333 RepID=A0A1H0ZTB3_9FLAO|nr:hypothetical protein SAMN05421664_1051 [Chryseobacterium soldanellicola]
MKNIISLFLLCFNALLFAQTNHFKITNFSSHDISFVAVSMNLSEPLMNCVPIIYNEIPAVLPAGHSISYSQINDSLVNDLPIRYWHLVGGSFEETYDLTLAPLSTSDTDLVSWHQVIIYAPNGQDYTLGGGCMGGGIYNITAGGIKAEFNLISGVADVVITDD